jgi:hypothetical protein
LADAEFVGDCGLAVAMDRKFRDLYKSCKSK